MPMELTNGGLPVVEAVEPVVVGVVETGVVVEVVGPVPACAGGVPPVVLATTAPSCQVYRTHRQVPITARTAATTTTTAVVFATCWSLYWWMMMTTVSTRETTPATAAML